MQKTKSDILADFQKKLDDILNSQESLVEKMGHVQVDLFNHPDKELEKAMNEMATQAGNTYAFIKETVDAFEAKVNAESGNASAKA